MIAGIPAVACCSPSPAIMHLLTSGGPDTIKRVVGEPKTCIESIITWSREGGGGGRRGAKAKGELQGARG